jgi:nucleoside-diphosphate-sugar epimerase/glycosyltransferase involved in cell wall biosynthesis
LDRGFAVRVLDRMMFGDEALLQSRGRAEIISGDIRDCPISVLDGCTDVIHLAAISTDPTAQSTPRLTDLVNHTATERLALMAKEVGVGRFVFASTCSVYFTYDTPVDPPFYKETDPLNPIAVYAIAKSAAEEAVRAMNDARFQIVVLRKGTLFGLSPRMRLDLVVNTFVRDAFLKRRLTVNCGGNIWRPLMDVGDLGIIYEQALTLPGEMVAGRTVNVLSENVNIGDLAQRVRNVLNTERGISIDVDIHSLGIPRNYKADSETIRQVFHYAPRRTIEDAVLEMWDAVATGAIADPTSKIYYNDSWHRHLLDSGDSRALRLDETPVPPAAAAADGAPRPFFSIIIPCLNGAQFLDACLHSLLDHDYPSDRFELIVVDGGSIDGSRAIASSYVSRNANVRVIDNPRRTIPTAMNLGIAAARGELVGRADAHSIYDKNYVPECVRGVTEFGADYVSGMRRIVPGSPTLLGRAIAVVLSHPFGVGRAFYRQGFDAKRPHRNDTVALLGCVRKEFIERVGGYDERLDRSEDIDLNGRLLEEGCRIAIVPTAISYYQSRSDIGAFVRHTMANGYWAIYPFRYSRLPISWRHYVPMAFIGSIILATALTVVFPLAGLLAVTALITYLILAVIVAVTVSRLERSVALAFVLPPLFLVFHIGYGLGSWLALLKVLAGNVHLTRRRVSPLA